MVVLCLISMVAARPSPQLQQQIGETFFMPLIGYPDHIQPMIIPGYNNIQPQGAPLQVQPRLEIVTNSPLYGQKLTDKFTVPAYDVSQTKLSRVLFSIPPYNIRSPEIFTVPSYDC